MKNALRLKFILTILLLNIIFCRVIEAQTRIAVLPFTTEENISKAVLNYLTEVFTVEMVNSRQFTVVERAKLDAALKEMSFQSGDMVDESTAVELGKMSGAEMVFFGTIFKFGGKNMLSVKGMDIKTATLKYAQQAGAETDVQMEAACKSIAAQIKKGEKKSVNGVSYNVEGSESGNLNKAEQKVYDKYIVDKWGIDPTNQEDMRYYYKQNKGIGIALTAVGPVCFVSGIIVTSLFCFMGSSYEWNYEEYSKDADDYDRQASTNSSNRDYYERYAADAREKANKARENASTDYLIGGFVGANLMTAGVVMTLCCIYPFILSQRIYSIYRKSTGQKLTFFDRTSFGGGYDWENKEVTVAMAIKL
ncbi:MAG: hypothetical protein IKQ61_09615 [Spirochaetales bacterium]|nr:hypothetical protein [Spirochaetales bacterium]